MIGLELAPDDVVRHGRVRARRGTPRRRSLGADPAHVSLSVIVPATNLPATLDACIEAILAADEPPHEVIVVDDPAAGGAGGARNAGARQARGEILVFVDSDVLVHRDAFSRIRAAFAADPELSGLFGSYDDNPSAPGVVSGFRNLLHHHVHQNNHGPMVTFWAGLGALRRADFEEVGGFNPAQPIEDVELGMRLTNCGKNLRLDADLFGTHLKPWTLKEMIRTDFIVRGAPWVELMIRHRFPSSRLNLSWRHRTSAASCLLALGAVLARRPKTAGASALTFVALNHDFYALLLRRRGPAEAVAGIGLHAIHYLVAVASVPAGWVLHLATSTAPPLPAATPLPSRVATASAAA